MGSNEYAPDPESTGESYRAQVSRNRSRFAAIAQSYATGQARRLDAQLLAELIRPLAVERILDVATGTAAAATVAATVSGGTVIGVDSSAAMLAQARAGAGPVRLAVAIIEELPFADAIFDLVLCTRALHHVRHPDLAVAEMARVVRSGGHIIVADNVTGYSGGVHDQVEQIQRLRDPGHASTLAENRIIELLRENSLDVVECHRTTSYRPLGEWLGDGGAGAAEAAEIRRRLAALGDDLDSGDTFGSTFVTEAGEAVGLRQAMSWIRAQRP